ncbi:unnamed protein product, partial [Polarella glacialis]
DQLHLRLDHLASTFRGLVLLPQADSGDKESQENSSPQPVVSVQAEAYWHLDCASEDGTQACEAFFAALDAAASSLGLVPASREHRQGFTLNYKIVFPDGARRYRSDVLEAALKSQQTCEIFVNGDAHKFSDAVLARGLALRHAWGTLVEALCRSSAGAQCPSPQLRALLQSLDEEWAAWEKVYITELIQIEQEARRPLLAAIEASRLLEEQLEGTDLFAELEEHASKCIDETVSVFARLNAVANSRGKGRGDLHGRVLRAAFDWLRQDREPEDCSELQGEGAQALIESVAGDVVCSFLKMQDYLREVALRMNEVDPSLANNSGLAERLLDLEESWAVGDRYLLDRAAFNSLLQLASTLEKFRRESPAFAGMLQECDAELFMVLPRLVWLSALHPGENRGGRLVLETILPDVKLIGDEPPQPGDRLYKLRVLFAKSLEGLVQWVHASTPSSCVSSGETLMAEVAAAVEQALFEAAVSGPGAAGKTAYEVLSKHTAITLRTPSPAMAPFETLEDLMRELEGWSLELQRHCPQDWNGLSAVLVKTLQDAAALQEEQAAASGQPFLV